MATLQGLGLRASADDGLAVVGGTAGSGPAHQSGRARSHLVWVLAAVIALSLIGATNAKATDCIAPPPATSAGTAGVATAQRQVWELRRETYAACVNNAEQQSANRLDALAHANAVANSATNNADILHTDVWALVGIVLGSVFMGFIFRAVVS